MLFRIVQHPAVQLDVAGVRLFDAGDALERQALAAAGGPQQGGDALFRLEGGVQHESAQILVDVHDQTHAFTAFFCRASNRFTVSRTTVLISRFTSTQ